MGRQSSRLWFGRDHKEIYYNGNYHKAMYLTDSESKTELVWEKLAHSNLQFSFVVKSSYSIGRHISFVVETIDGCTIDWGDGSSTQQTSNATFASHEYRTSGDYTINIYGDVQNISSLTNKNIYEILTPFPETMSVREDFSRMFYSSGVNYVCQDLFKYCTSAKDFTRCFSESALREIPDGLFSYCENAESFSSCFKSCDNLTKVGKNVFKNCISSIDFTESFMYTPIKEIPQGIFDDCVFAQYFTHCFDSCGEVKEGIPQGVIVPDGLFSHTYNALDFSYCLANIRFTHVVEGYTPQVFNRTFQNCSNANNFNYCFANSTGFEIGNLMFAGCKEALYFSDSFAKTNITSIPNDLFDDCQNVISFGRTFASCVSITGNVPALWERDNVEGHRECFLNCVNASNYNDIPIDWK